MYYAVHNPSKSMTEIFDIVSKRVGTPGWELHLDVSLEVKYGESPGLSAGLHAAAQRAREAELGLAEGDRSGCPVESRGDESYD